MKLKSLIFTFIISSSMISSYSFANPIDQNTTWNYQNHDEKWGDNYPTCNGKNQSPINIISATKSNLEPLKISYNGTIDNIINNGHTIQVNVKGNNTVKIDGETFNLVQFHFHTPSENLIKNKKFPLELHFVNKNKNGDLAVIGIMYNVSTTRNNNGIMNEITKELPKKGKTLDINSEIKLNTLLPRVIDYYRFNGSLTTPPCTEGVRWFIIKSQQSITKNELKKLESIMGNNARNIQNINARVILK